jgi:hypothetical protein
MLKCNILLAAVVAAAPALRGQGVLTPGQPTNFYQSGMYSWGIPGS